MTLCSHAKDTLGAWRIFRAGGDSSTQRQRFSVVDDFVRVCFPKDHFITSVVLDVNRDVPIGLQCVEIDDEWIVETVDLQFSTRVRDHMKRFCFLIDFGIEFKRFRHDLPG
jgi:hypothetical protein